MGIRESALQIINNMRSTDKLRVVTAEDNSRSITMGDLMDDAAGYFSDVASSGDYDDLLNRPTIPTMGQILNAIYPVGSYYWTSDSNFNPQTAIGGTWEKIDPGVTLVSAGTGYTVQTGTAKDGGDAMVTLTKEQSGLPAHGHGFTQPSVSGGAVSSGITGGSHLHKLHRTKNIASGSNILGISNSGTAGDTQTLTSEHTHNLPAHSHTVSGGAVSQNDGANAAQAHNNMPPYKAAYCWHRIG